MPKPNKPNRSRQNDPDDDDDEGGDGGGGAFSDEQRTELGNLINAAVSGQLSRKLPSAIKGALDESLSPIREMLEQNNGKRRRDDEGDDEGDDDEDQPPARGKRGARARDEEQRGKSSKDPKVAKLEQEVEKMRKEREAERMQLRNRERDAMLREELAAAGVETNRMRGAIAVLRDQLVYDDKAGEWSYRTKRDGVDEDMDVSAGVKEWAGTDEGKSYLAAQQAGGSRGGGQQRQGAGVRINGQQQRAAGGGVINRGQQQPNAQQQRAANRQEAVQNLAAGVNELLGASVTVG